MPPRLISACFLMGAIDLAWSAVLVAAVRFGVVHTWLVYFAPVTVLAALGIWLHGARYWVRIHNSERAAGAALTALARPHAPLSFPAAVRDPVHRSLDLPARADR